MSNIWWKILRFFSKMKDDRIKKQTLKEIKNRKIFNEKQFNKVKKEYQERDAEERTMMEIKSKFPINRVITNLDWPVGLNPYEEWHEEITHQFAIVQLEYFSLVRKITSTLEDNEWIDELSFYRSYLMSIFNDIKESIIWWLQFEDSIANLLYSVYKVKNKKQLISKVPEVKVLLDKYSTKTINLRWLRTKWILENEMNFRDFSQKVKHKEMDIFSPLCFELLLGKTIFHRVIENKDWSVELYFPNHNTPKDLWEASRFIYNECLPLLIEVFNDYIAFMNQEMGKFNQTIQKEKLN